jgi:hypothetical protein
MAHGKNKYQSRESRRIVRDLLMSEWDPINIKNRQGYEDEYDAYVGAVYVKLMDEKASTEQIERYLLDVTANHIGIPLDANVAARCSQTAKALTSLRPKFEIH